MNDKDKLKLYYNEVRKKFLEKMMSDLYDEIDDDEQRFQMCIKTWQKIKNKVLNK